MRKREEKTRIQNLISLFSFSFSFSLQFILTSVRKGDRRDRVRGVEDQRLARPVRLDGAKVVRDFTGASPSAPARQRPDESDERVEHRRHGPHHRHDRQRVERPHLHHAEVDQHEDDDPPTEPAAVGSRPAGSGLDERDDFLKRDRRGDGVGDGNADEEDDLERGEEPEAPGARKR